MSEYDSVPLFNNDYDLSYVYQNDKGLTDLDTSINLYSSNINIDYYNDDNIINKDEILENVENYPITDLYNDIKPNKQKYSTSLSNLNSNFINQLNSDHVNNNDTMTYYIDKQNIRNELKKTNDTLNIRYYESIQQPYYIFFIVWCFIFILLIFTLMLNLIEDESHINLFTKLLLFLVFGFILLKSYKNIVNYFNN
tara:strand:+ start:720 stop:1307 length:588 start_codon:yes stop_codon:yes gene_type:complete